MPFTGNHSLEDLEEIGSFRFRAGSCDVSALRFWFASTRLQKSGFRVQSSRTPSSILLWRRSKNPACAADVKSKQPRIVKIVFIESQVSQQLIALLQ
jgi:hypothetical protein